MLEQQFAKLGLNDNEREVYLAVLKAGKATPQRVSKLTGINRTTVYSIARKLMGLGLISEDLGAKTSYLSAESPEALGRLFEKEKQELSTKQAAARELVQELRAHTSAQSYSIPRIKFVEEDDLASYLYKRYPEWGASGLKYDNTWWGHHDDSFTKEYGAWIDWCWTQPPENVAVRFFTNRADVEKEMEKKHPDRLVKTLPVKDGFDSSLWVIGDYIIMVQSRERPHYLVEMYDTVLARNERYLFRSLWGLA